MTENEKRLYELLYVLKKEGMLENLILIGSWATTTYIYLFNNYHPNIMTIDLDLYAPNPKIIRERNSIVNSLKGLNYDIVYDTLTNKSKFISPDGFEIEFLTKENRNRTPTTELGNTKIYAESLTYIDIFNNNYLEINYKGINLKVAHPAAYVLQKLLINKKRKAKAQKDISSIISLMSYINKKPCYSKDFLSLYESLPKNWKKKILNAISDNGLSKLFSKYNLKI